MADKVYHTNSEKLRSSLILCHSVANFLFNKFRFFGSRSLSRLFSKIVLPELKTERKTFVSGLPVFFFAPD